MDHGDRLGQPLRRAGHQQGRPDGPVQIEIAVARGDLQIGERLAAQSRHGAPAPVRPAAVAADDEGHRLVGPRQAGDEAVARRLHVDREVEPVRGRHRVEQQPHPVAAREAGRRDRARIERHQRAAVGDLRPPVQRDQVAPPGNCRVDRQPPDMEAGDVERDVGQQGRVRVAGPQRQVAGHPRLRDVQLAHVDPAAEQIGQRPVIERRRRRGRERALRVAELDVAQRQLAVDRAVDPLDMDPEAGRGLGRVDPVDDPAMAGIGVQPEQEARNGRDQNPQDDRHPFGDPPPQGTLAEDHDGLGRHFAGHQKACPIET